MAQNLETAYKFSRHNRPSIKTNALCGCFYCQKIFSPKAITAWRDEQITALCPFCGVDSVLSTTDVPNAANAAFLKTMHQYWFGAAALI
jgi:hypothetical protein